MKFVALIFACLAIIPQALKGMVYGLASMNKCTLPAKECLIGDNDQSKILNMLYGPSFWTTTGLWIGGAGLVVCIIIMKIMTTLENRATNATYDRAGRQNGGQQGSQRRAQSRQAETGDDGYGRAPRPPAFDRHGRPRN